MLKALWFRGDFLGLLIPSLLLSLLLLPFLLELNVDFKAAAEENGAVGEGGARCSSEEAVVAAAEQEEGGGPKGANVQKRDEMQCSNI